MKASDWIPTCIVRHYEDEYEEEYGLWSLKVLGLKPNSFTELLCDLKQLM